MACSLRPVFLFSVLLSLFFSSSAQTCNSFNSFSKNKIFKTCTDLPYLSSYLHWNYDQSTGKLDLAFRNTGVSSTNTWVAWGINPSNNIQQAMPGAQTVVAIPQSGGLPKVFTAPVGGYGIKDLKQGDLSFNVSSLTATYKNGEIIIYATMMLPKNPSSVLQVWQQGPVSGTTLQSHSTTDSNNLNSKGTLNLLSGQTQTASGNSKLRRRNIHGVINTISWGILMPMGALIARYLKVFKSADPAWFYLHVTCQTSAYIIGVAGWGTGLKLGSQSVGITYDAHRILGITLFCLGTLQVFALLLRPKQDHKYRRYWNIYHYLIGYSVMIISIINIFKGFDILQPADKWKHSYIGIIIALGALAVVLEGYTWLVVLQRKKSERKTSHGVNGVNGHGSRTNI